MARTKEQDQKLANSLGISYEELQQTEWELFVVVDDGNNIVEIPLEVIVRFGEKSPKHILAKIKGLNEDNEVSLSPAAAGE